MKTAKERSRTYFSLDVEDVGHFNLVAIGAALVHDPSKTFYVELQPRHFRYELDAMRVACSELDVLRSYELQPQYNPRHKFFHPTKTIALLRAIATPIPHAMRGLDQWVRKNTRKNSIAMMAPIPELFDGGRIDFYLHEYLQQSPFTFWGFDPYSAFCGLEKDEHADMSKLKDRIPKNEREHNAEADAVRQAFLIQEVLKLLRGNNFCSEDFI